ncbi:MAG TPA: thioredoxin family protein, partial [Legionellales bacterium]|nr:thioredoxin family protein [Legionellales bacterium]
MAKMQSVMVPLGTNAPEFVLPDTISDKLIKFKDLTSDIATVVMFICNH